MSDRRPKILFCMHMPPPIHGAAVMGQYIRESIIINTSYECRYVNIATASSVEDIGKGGLRKLWRIMHKRHEIVDAVRKFKPDVVYVTPNSKGGAFCKDYLFVQQLKRMHCKVILHFHNKGVAADTRYGLKKWLYKRFFANTHVILLSELLYPDIAAFVPHSNVHICPNGIPDVEICKKNITQSTPHILFLSNLLRAKGVYTLIDACAILNYKHINFHCDLVGAEGDISATRLQSLIAEKDLQDVITYHGTQNGIAKQAFYDNSDIFVLPTENECFPLVLLEAMRSEVACVSTFEGAIPEILDNGRCGVLVPSKDANAFARALEGLLTNEPLRRQFADYGRNTFLQKYTISIFEHRLKDILTEVLKQ